VIPRGTVAFLTTGKIARSDPATRLFSFRRCCYFAPNGFPRVGTGSPCLELLGVFEASQVMISDSEEGIARVSGVEPAAWETTDCSFQ
jgi:hypothetical protein